MLEALARKKAHRLMDKSGGNQFGGKSRPQEDLITSEIFGNARIFMGPDRHDALDVLLGPTYVEHAKFDRSSELEISLWPQLGSLLDRKYVEPDVLLTCAKRTVLIEVKWHAQLSERQVEQQIEAAEQHGHTVVAAVILGEAKHTTTEVGVPLVYRTWREVSADLRQSSHSLNATLRTWATMVGAALQNTDMGHTFAGLDGRVYAEPPGAVSYRFSAPGRPPWLKVAPYQVPAVQFNFQGNQDD